MNPLDRFNQAMESERGGEELGRTIFTLAQEGYTKEAINDAMDKLLDQVREKHGGAESAEEDIVLEVMDALVGWCHPKARLL
jgi:hypothetical protein